MIPPGVPGQAPPHRTTGDVSQADTHHNAPTAHLSAFHAHTVAPRQPNLERPPTGLTQPHSHSDDDLRQAHLTHRVIGQARRPHEHTPTTAKLGQPTTTTHTRATTQQHNSHELGPTNTATKRSTHQHTHSTSSARIRDDGQPEGEVTRPHRAARPLRVLRSAKSCKFENWINHFRSLLGCDGVPESCGIVACGFRTRHGGTVTAQGCRTAGRSDLSRTAGSLQSELTSWPHPYSQDRSSTHVPHEPASSDLSLKSRQSSDSCGDGEIRTPEGLPPQPP